MSFTRSLPEFASQATTVFVGSTAGGQLLIASNAARGDLVVQPLTDAFRVGPAPSMSASSPLFIASGQIVHLPNHNGAVYALPGGGATAAIGIWESGY